jgi:hypothetical protein
MRGTLSASRSTMAFNASGRWAAMRAIRQSSGLHSFKSSTFKSKTTSLTTRRANSGTSCKLAGMQVDRIPQSLVSGRRINLNVQSNDVMEGSI